MFLPAKRAGTSGRCLLCLVVEFQPVWNILANAKLEKSEPQFSGWMFETCLSCHQPENLFLYISSHLHLAAQTPQKNTTVKYTYAKILFLKKKQIQTWWIHQYPIQPFKNRPPHPKHKKSYRQLRIPHHLSPSKWPAKDPCSHTVLFIDGYHRYVPTKVKDKNYWHSTGVAYLVVEFQRYLKNMRTSNWIISPKIRMKPNI